MNIKEIRHVLVIKLVLVLYLMQSHVFAQDEPCNVEDIGCSCLGAVVDCSEKMFSFVPHIDDETMVHSIMLLKNNQIEVITASDFDGYTNLITLDLSFNAISSIGEAAFEDLQSLNTFLLSGNRLEYLGPRHLQGLENLQTITLNNNERLTIDTCLFSHLPYLTALVLHQTRVDLSHAIVTSPTECRTSPELNRFEYTTTLKSLSIGYEGTSSDASLLINFPNLTSLTLHSFTKNSFGSSNVSSLHRLNRILLDSAHVFPKDFLISSSVTSLIIVESTFPCLPADAIFTLPSLETLHLMRSDLRRIDKRAFRGASNLTSINLSYNQLTTLPYGIFDEVGNSNGFLRLVTTFNDWACDCRLEWLQEFLSTDPRLTDNSNNLFCKSPSSFRGMSLLDIDLDECEKEERTPPDDYEIVCNVRATSSPVMTTTQGTGGESTDGVLDNLMVYYIIACVALVMLIIIVILFIAVCLSCNRACKKMPPADGTVKPEANAQNNGENNTGNFQRQARTINNYQQGDGNSTDGHYQDEGYVDPNKKDNYEKPVSMEPVYDNAPTREEELAQAYRESHLAAEDMRYVIGLDFGGPQRSSVSYVNEAPKYPPPRNKGHVLPPR